MPLKALERSPKTRLRTTGSPPASRKILGLKELLGAGLCPVSQNLEPQELTGKFSEFKEIARMFSHFGIVRVEPLLTILRVDRACCHLDLFRDCE
jgi:hypothetical protein